MEREPGEISPSGPNDEPDVISDAALSAWLESLPPCPGIPHTEEEVETAVARARRQLDDGRGVPHEEVSKWLATWGTPDEKPMPREWLE